MSMTAEQQKQAADLTQAAQTAVQYNVYLPTFLNKLAAVGIVPQTEDECVRLIETAQQLRGAYDHQNKSASSNLIDAGHRRLFGDQAVKQAAVNQKQASINQLVGIALQDAQVNAALDVLIGMEQQVEYPSPVASLITGPRREDEPDSGSAPAHLH